MLVLYYIISGLFECNNIVFLQIIFIIFFLLFGYKTTFCHKNPSYRSDSSDSGRFIRFRFQGQEPDSDSDSEFQNHVFKQLCNSAPVLMCSFNLMWLAEELGTCLTYILFSKKKKITNKITLKQYRRSL